VYVYGFLQFLCLADRVRRFTSGQIKQDHAHANTTYVHLNDASSGVFTDTK
jgi:hypothetical protein